VFKPISETWLLAEALCRETLWEGAQVLDVCTGSGALAITAAERGADVTAVDVARRALLTTAINARLNGVTIETLRGCLFDAVPGRRFDCIVCNPPYVPSLRADLPTSGPSRAWEAGRDGRVVLHRLIDEAPAHLRPNGVLVLTHSALIGEEETLERLQDAGLSADVVERRKEPLGPLMRERLAQGVLPAGTTEDEILVFRGQQKPANTGQRRARPLHREVALP
jgi:release factor glutamine methyltransferase